MTGPSPRPPSGWRLLILRTSLPLGSRSCPAAVGDRAGLSDKAGAGLAFGAFAVSARSCGLAGRLADTRGRRPLLVGGALLSALECGRQHGVRRRPCAGCPAASGAWGYEAAFFVAALAALADLAPPSRMGEAAANSLGLYLGLAFGPPLGELLVGSAASPPLGTERPHFFSSSP